MTIILDDLTADVARDSSTLDADNFITLVRSVSIAVTVEIDKVD